MIAPTNCCPDCDCAQRMVRCQRAAPVESPIDHGAVAEAVEEAAAYMAAHPDVFVPFFETPPYVIPACLAHTAKIEGDGRIVKFPEGTTADEAFEAVEHMIPLAGTEFLTNEQKKTPLYDIPTEELLNALAWMQENFPELTMTPHQRLVKAFRECDLDCGMWSDNALSELADIVIATLEAA